MPRRKNCSPCERRDGRDSDELSFASREHLSKNTLQRIFSTVLAFACESVDRVLQADADIFVTRLKTDIGTDYVNN